MAYLADASLFLLLMLALVAFGWAVSDTQSSVLESSLLPGAALLGSFAFVVWVVGSLVAFTPIVFAGALIGVIVGVLGWRRHWVVANARRFFSSLGSLGALEKLLLFYLGVVWALAFVLCLAPPSGADYDSLVYHLAIPAQYLRAGKIVQFQYDHHSYFPFTMEMLYGVALGVRGVVHGAVFAKLFHWLMLPVGSLALVALGRRAGTRQGGLVAAALYTAMPMALAEATTSYIDLGFTAWALLAVLCFVGAPSEERNRNLLWCGVFCGFCLGTKYLGALIFGFLGLWLLVAGLKAKTLRVAHIAAFALPALLLGAPWYIRNIVWTHSPVFPFAYGIFGGQGWTQAMATQYDADQKVYGFGTSLPDLVLLPWRLAMAPVNAINQSVTGIPSWPLGTAPVSPPLTGLFDVRGLFFQSFPGPALLALGLPALFATKKPRPVLLAAWFFGFLWLFWAITSQQVRYLFPGLALLCLVAGWGVAEGTADLRLSRLLGGLLLAVWLVFAPAFMLHNARGSLGVISGQETPDQYINRTFGASLAMQWIGENTPVDAKIAVYGEPRCFYLPRAYFWADPQHNLLVSNAMKNGAPNLAAALRQLGASYILLNTTPGTNNGAFGPPQPLFNQMVQSGEAQLQIVPSEYRGYSVYKLKTP